VSVARQAESTAPETAPSAHERFGRVFEEHVRAVSAYALRRTTPMEADDVVAETFLIAWRRLDELPPDAKPWLLGVARRVLANQRRAAGRRRALAERVTSERTGVHGAEPTPPVLLALARLSERDRETLLLTAWDGLSPAEAAVAFGCSQTAFKVRLHRARGRLRTELRRLERARPHALLTGRLEES
jgi:RNA polymerase sigma-70 factor (ECF subfamily)